MKLLTLEEITLADINLSGAMDALCQLNTEFGEVEASSAYIEGLLATSRAYWELKNKIVDPSNIEKFIGVERLKEEDKPHARTIRAVIDAIRRITYTTKLGKVTAINATEAIKSLEKHLE